MAGTYPDEARFGPKDRNLQAYEGIRQLPAHIEQAVAEGKGRLSPYRRSKRSNRLFSVSVIFQRQQIVHRGTSVYTPLALEGSHSGLVRTLGKRVDAQVSREFESPPLRQTA